MCVWSGENFSVIFFVNFFLVRKTSKSLLKKSIKKFTRKFTRVIWDVDGVGPRATGLQGAHGGPHQQGVDGAQGPRGRSPAEAHFSQNYSSPSPGDQLAAKAPQGALRKTPLGARCRRVERTPTEVPACPRGPQGTVGNPMEYHEYLLGTVRDPW